MKKAIFVPQSTWSNHAGSYKIIIKNSKKDGWEGINGKILFDFQLEAVRKDLEKEGYKTEIKKGLIV